MELMKGIMNELRHFICISFSKVGIRFTNATRNVARVALSCKRFSTTYNSYHRQLFACVLCVCICVAILIPLN